MLHVITQSEANSKTVSIKPEGCVRNGKRGDYATRAEDHRQIHSLLFQDQCSTHFNWREKKNTGGRKILRGNHQGHFYVDLS